MRNKHLNDKGEWKICRANTKACKFSDNLSIKSDAIPARLQKTSAAILSKSDAESWLNNLPVTIEFYKNKWNINQFYSFANTGAMSAVLFGDRKTKNGNLEPICLKIPMSERVGRTEISDLKFWRNSNLFPELLDYDSKSGVFMMRTIDVAHDDLTEDQEAFKNLLIEFNEVSKDKKYAETLNNSLNKVSNFTGIINTRIQWAKADELHINDKENFDKAVNVINDLLKSDYKKQLILGDLQSKNILTKKDNSLVLIDPMNCSGDINYSVALWISSQNNGRQSIRENLDEFSKLDFLDKNRLEAWTFALSILERRIDRRPQIAKRINNWLESEPELFERY